MPVPMTAITPSARIRNGKALMPSMNVPDDAADDPHVGGARERADERADEERDQHADERHDHVQLHGREAAREDVAAELVGAERMREARRLQRARRRRCWCRTGSTIGISTPRTMIDHDDDDAGLARARQRLEPRGRRASQAGPRVDPCRDDVADGADDDDEHAREQDDPLDQRVVAAGDGVRRAGSRCPGRLKTSSTTTADANSDADDVAQQAQRGRDRGPDEVAPREAPAADAAHDGDLDELLAQRGR